MVVDVNVYLFLFFLDLTYHFEEVEIGGFLAALCRLIVTGPNLEVATKRILYQQVKIMR